jgi:hypothetical protein
MNSEFSSGVQRSRLGARWTVQQLAEPEEAHASEVGDHRRPVRPRAMMDPFEYQRRGTDQNTQYWSCFYRDFE